MPVGLSGRSARRTPSIHQLSGEARPMAWGVGWAARQEDRAETRRTAHRHRLGVAPRFPRVQADGRHDDPDRDHRDEAEGHPDDEGEPVDAGGVEADAEEEHPGQEGHGRPDEADPDPGDPSSEQDDPEIAWAHVDVAEHPVALPIVEDRPGQPGDPAHDERPQGTPHTTWPDRRGRPATDDVDYEDEDEDARQRLGDRVDREDDGSVSSPP
jgi:hypothetical protein